MSNKLKGPKMTQAQKEDAAKKLIVNEVEKAVNLLVDHFKNFSKTHGTPVIGLTFIEESAKIFLSSYKSSALK